MVKWTQFPEEVLMAGDCGCNLIEAGERGGGGGFLPDAKVDTSYIVQFRIWVAMGWDSRCHGSEKNRGLQLIDRRSGPMTSICAIMLWDPFPVPAVMHRHPSFSLVNSCSSAVPAGQPRARRAPQLPSQSPSTFLIVTRLYKSSRRSTRRR